ncbi:3-keto-disaccharide hydrolase [Robiginitalea sediminis]|uniref:3-keto-disaccharide hydrolase n=1 Tax=Robiginitalea sediminis TaxID=1982593 RepID=UPI0018EA1DB8|nr:DUF1080 domain-containing protein [Robiginitalea sediminis]
MKKYVLTPILLGLLIMACKTEMKNESEGPTDLESTRNPVALNTLTPEEEAEGWSLLFDGITLDGWHLYNKPGVPSIWKVEDGVLVCDPLNGTGDHGDLVTDQTYGNYELSLEWELPTTGNSGIFINVQEAPEYERTYHTGPEYQLLGEAHLDYELPAKRSGCLYNYAPQETETTTRPEGQWNHTRIVQKDGKVEFYLNGNRTASMDFTGADWAEWIGGSGFRNNSGFGKSTSGHIGLQLWTSAVRFRNIKIREF